MYSIYGSKHNRGWFEIKQIIITCTPPYKYIINVVLNFLREWAPTVTTNRLARSPLLRRRETLIFFAVFFFYQENRCCACYVNCTPAIHYSSRRSLFGYNSVEKRVKKNRLKLWSRWNRITGTGVYAYVYARQQTPPPRSAIRGYSVDYYRWRNRRVLLV